MMSHPDFWFIVRGYDVKELVTAGIKMFLQ